MLRTGTWALAAAVVLSLFLTDAAPAAALKCGPYQATIVGTPRNDMIVGTPRRDVIQARGGSDVIRALAGNDRVCGGPGNDRIYGGRGRDGVFASKGADTLWGGPGNDRLLDGDGSDVTYGGGGADVNFLTDDDVEATPIVLGGGSDLFFGGAGADLVVDGAGSDLADLGLGDDLAVDAGTGNDIYRGGDGSDNLGLRPSLGDDVFDGGPGTDGVFHLPFSLRYGGYPGPVLVNLTTGQLQGVQQGNDTLLSVENARGTPYSDTLIGNAEPNVLEGGPSYEFGGFHNPDDHIEGLDGDDRLVIDLPGEGFRKMGFLDGGNGTDTCQGGATVLNCELTAATARLERLFPSETTLRNWPTTSSRSGWSPRWFSSPLW